MKQLILSLFIGLGLMSGLGAIVSSPVSAINVFEEGCKGQTSAVCKDTGTDTVDPVIQNIIGILIFAIAAISVIMIIVGGIRYVISNGDSSRVKSAKDTIMYAVVGLVVALLAYAIVNFVLKQFS